MGAPGVSQRAGRIAAFEVMDVVRAAGERDRRGEVPPTCHLEVGQPSAPTPRSVIDAARASLEGPLGYTDTLGTPELRGRISDFYAQRHAASVPPQRTAVTAGASAGVVLTLLALCDPGERIVVFEPGYPCYSNVAESLGVEVVSVPLSAETQYRPTTDLLDAAARSEGSFAAVVVASPSNPTGTVLSERDLDALNGWCDGHGATLVVDEIYHGTATETLATASRFTDTVVVQSFSKYFCMTGWRLGWLVLPEPLVRPVERLSQNLYLSPHALSQAAACAAFDVTAELDGHARTYERNKEILVGSLVAVGVEDIAPPQGAFYVWADVSAWGPSTELCRRWLEEIGVAATPGTDFDSTHGSSFVRFSVAGSTEEVTEAASRLTGWMTGNPLRAAS